MKSEIVWTEEDMIDATIEVCWDDADAKDCKVINDGECLFVVHVPTGRTSTEAGNGGRWNLDGTVCE